MAPERRQAKANRFNRIAGQLRGIARSGNHVEPCAADGVVVDAAPGGVGIGSVTDAGRHEVQLLRRWLQEWQHPESQQREDSKPGHRIGGWMCR